MNFLAIVQALRRESIDSGTGPTTVVGQTGELARMVNWCADAYSELQLSRPDWFWLRREFTVNTVAGTDSYANTSCTDTTDSAAISRFSRWYEGYDTSGFPYFRAYLSSSGVGGEYGLVSIDWDWFRRLYKLGTQNNGTPVHVTVGPDRKFYLGPKPDAVYVVSGSYQRSPQTLALDADTPEMPSQFHPLIWMDALAKYGGNRVAPEAILRAITEGGNLRLALRIDQLPKMGLAEALA